MHTVTPVWVCIIITTDSTWHQVSEQNDTFSKKKVGIAVKSRKRDTTKGDVHCAGRLRTHVLMNKDNL